MKILILSSAPWNNKNSFGNTFSNLFSSLPDMELANIYCKPGMPENQIVSRYFQFTEKSILKNRLHKQSAAGRELNLDKQAPYGQIEKKAMFFAKKKRWQILFWIRDLIWLAGRWKCKELIAFVDSFAPDILYMPIYYSKYMCRIALFLHSYLKVPMVGHVTDDVYTLKQFRVSPLYWIDRLLTRREVRNMIRQCTYVDTFTDIQKQEYERIFHKEFRIVRKSAVFPANRPPCNALAKPLRVVFTGNITSGRWRSLVLLGRAMDRCNRETDLAQLIIYTASPMNKKIKREFAGCESIDLREAVDAKEIHEIQRNADVLVHAESFSLRDRLEVRMSFSTKIVDYLSCGRCIFAIGPAGVASVDYLLKNDAAIVAQTPRQIEQRLCWLLDKPARLDLYAEKAWKTGKKNHSAENTKPVFLQALKSVMQ